MHIQFIESRFFTAQLPLYLDDEDYRALQNFLLKQPDAGDIISGTGGFRKLRWQDSKRGKGKRGGLRVLYYWLSSEGEIWLFSLYDKDEKLDLTTEEKRTLKTAIATELRERGLRHE